MLPVLSPKALASASNPQQTQSKFPPNLADVISPDLAKEIWRDMFNDFIFPQISERRMYEPIWDKLLQMYRIKMDRDKMHFPKTDEKTEDTSMDTMDGSKKSQVSDSLIYDTVDRLKNLNHFISWKDGTPVQYSLPKYMSSSKEDKFYHPLADKIKSANGLLNWNLDSQEVYRKHLILSQHHYLYGTSYVLSEFEYQTAITNHRNNQGGMTPTPEVLKMGVTFEPLSIRRLWLNYRISTYAMEHQPCPFWFEETPRFAILQNKYDPVQNPFGYSNLDKLAGGQWLFSQSEMESLRTAYSERIGGNSGPVMAELLKPENSVEALWTFFPMLPFDPVTGEYKTRKDGTPVPMLRFIWQVYSSSLHNGEMMPVRFQRNFYPKDQLPLYGSTHMPDMDSGSYGMAIGEVLENHYAEICTVMNQVIDNKNWINNPPSWFVIGSPCATKDRTTPGADIPVTGPNDFGWRAPYDATATSTQILESLRDGAKTTSKAVDALMGKALGGRTSATEAQNVFQAAMSGVTTDINMFNHDIMGGYADKVWLYCGEWLDPEVIKEVTGQYGVSLTVEDMAFRIGLKWDVGSTYIESIVKQGHLRYALETGARSQALDQSILWREFFEELRLPEMQAAVLDNDFSRQVAMAQTQAIETYLGKQIKIDPAQDHNTAMEVKIRFLQDTDSEWNKQYGANPSVIPGLTTTQYLSKQIEIHQQFAMLQMQQMQMQQMEQMQAQAALKGGGSTEKNGPETMSKAGDVMQQSGGPQP